MGWVFAISLVVFLGICLRAWVDEVFEGFIVAFLVCVVVFTTGTMLVDANSDHEYTVVDEKNSYELVALTNDTDVSGQFFLGTGSIGEDQVYAFMYLEDGGVRTGRIDADEVRLYEDSESPRIETLQRCVDLTFFWTSCTQRSVKNVYIPEGSIWMGYEVDIRDF